MILDILFWLVIALLILASFAQIMMIGKPREAQTPAGATFTIALNVVILAILIARVYAA